MHDAKPSELEIIYREGHLISFRLRSGEGLGVGAATLPLRYFSFRCSGVGTGRSEGLPCRLRSW